jgi:hypothetical protein
MEAIRCVKRRLSDIVYQQMLDDALVHTWTSSGGQQGKRLWLQPDRLTAQRRLFGQATSRTRHQIAQDPTHRAR